MICIVGDGARFTTKLLCDHCSKLISEHVRDDGLKSLDDKPLTDLFFLTHKGRCSEAFQRAHRECKVAVEFADLVVHPAPHLRLDSDTIAIIIQALNRDWP